MKTYNCIQCNKISIVGRSKSNKFCSIQCQANYRWDNETKPRVERGECTSNSRALRPYIIKEHGEKCALCGLGTLWNNKNITLQMDHIDGNSDNNFPQNLRLLCPNCHSQTENFGSKGKGNRYKKVTKRNKYLQEYKTSLAQE